MNNDIKPLKNEFTFNIKEKSYDNKLYYSWDCQEYIEKNIRPYALQTFEDIKIQLIKDLDNRDVILKDVNTNKIYCSEENCLKSDDLIKYIQEKYKNNENNEKTLNFLACINQSIYAQPFGELTKLYANYYGYTFLPISLKQGHFILKNNILKTEFKYIYFIPELNIMVDVIKVNYVLDFNDNGKIEFYLSKRLISPLFTINYNKINNKDNTLNLNNDFITFLFSTTNLSDIFFIENKEDLLKLNETLLKRLNYKKENLFSNNKSKNNIMTMSKNFIKILFNYYDEFNLLDFNIKYKDQSTVNVFLGTRLISHFNINTTNNKRFIIEKTSLIINTQFNENMFSMNRYILPYQKNNMNIVNESNLLIVSFNEANTKYNLLDTLILINKILMDNPLFVIINTQESLIRNVTEKIKGRIDFHGPFGKMMKLIEYEKLDEVSGGVMKAKVAIGMNKNVRTSVYYDKKKVNSSIPKKKLFRSTKKIAVQNNSNNNDKINILPCTGLDNKQYLKSTQSKLGTISNSTWFKGSICYHLCFETSKGEMKFIFVNSHLFFESKSYKGKKNDENNTGLKKRIHNFESLVKEFKLIEKYEEGYNIFFSGDLNFRLTLLGPNMNSNFKEYLFQMNKINNKKTIDKYLLDTVKKYLKKLKAIYDEDNNERNAYNATLYVKNEIKNFLESKKNDLYKEFNKSIKELGTHLSMKYPESTQDDLIKFYTKYIYGSKNIDELTFEEIEKIFKIYSNEVWYKTNKVPRPPSMPDRILCATHEDDILPLRKKDLKMYLFPVKSDHKMISLDIRLDLEKSNLNNLKPVVKNFKQKKKKLLTHTLNDINTLDKFKKYLQELNNEAPLQKMSIELINKIESLFTDEEKEYLSKLKFNNQYNYFIQKDDKTYHFNELLFTKIMNGTLNTSGNPKKLYQFYFCDSSS